ncbi:MAG: lysostaphin resistance A-like protein [Terriglobia bacterium]
MEHSEEGSVHFDPAPEAGRAAIPHSPEPWTLLDLLFFVVFAVFTFAFTGIIALTAYNALNPVMGWTLQPRVLGQNTFFLLGVQLAAYILIFGYIYFLVVYHYRFRFWKGIKWGHLNNGRILSYVGGGIVLTIWIQIAATFLPDKGTFPLEKMFSSQDASYALAVFAVVIGPFMEELIFRGVLFSIFEARAGLAFAVLATAVLFAAMHIPEYSGAWNHVLFILLVGLVLSLTRGLTRSLAPCVILHVTYNGCLMVVLFFAT